MSPKSNAPVIVTGDITVDWNIARAKQLHGDGSMWNVDDCTRAYPQPGGAALLGELIETVAQRLPAPHKVIRPTLPQILQPSDSCYHHSYAMWSLCKFGESPGDEKEKAAWRVEEFLGVDRCQQNGKSSGPADAERSTSASLVVIDDANLGFRDRPDLWPKTLRSQRPPWTLVKMSQPVAQGALWDYLRSHGPEKLIVVMTVNDLRLTEVQISRQISWERTAQDLAWELVHNPQVNSLSRCAWVIVSFDTAGVFLLSRDNASARPRSQLFFDPRVIEGMWERQHPGYMIGHTVSLTAGLARQILMAPDNPDIAQGIQSGLGGMRRLHREGYGRRGSSVSEADLSYPLEIVAEELESNRTDFAVVDVQDPVRFLHPGKRDAVNDEPGFWTILADRYTQTLDSVAENIVIDGPEATLTDIPLGRFGKLLTVDRHEIESFRSIGSLIDEYCKQSKPKRPLSIAVFGAPGAGKSFGIVEVAKSLRPGQIEVREFNVSQLVSPEDILEALHQVRDVGLSGQIPLVFWDEFDTSLHGQPLGWLRYFLAPMQDGKFQQGQITHPIGRAIFVFAGGTCENMATFDRSGEDREFKNVKGPDFVSRLKGYVNILGPNTKDPIADPYFIIRRAILLRSILQRDASQLFQRDGKRTRLRIDRGVLRALLRTKSYKHGVRSIESVIAMSALAGKSTFERSALPAEEQLNLHVNARDFLALMQQLDLNGDFLERLAAAAHDVYRENLRSKGYRSGARTNEKLKVSSSLGAYEDLPEDEKEQNRGNVRDIANKLALAGYVMIPARNNEPPFDFPGVDLEQLAEMEHERWMRLKLERGWRYGPRTDKKKEVHEALVPWQKLSAAQRERLYGEYRKALGPGVLPESEKKKDRMLVLGIPRILARAGYTVLKIDDGAGNLTGYESENGQNRRDRASTANRARKNKRGHRSGVKSN